MATTSQKGLGSGNWNRQGSFWAQIYYTHSLTQQDRIIVYSSLRGSKPQKAYPETESLRAMCFKHLSIKKMNFIDL